MISIAMTTYNGEKYIREQIDSLLRQTVPFDELIICDDGSTDATVSIITQYSENDERIKVYTSAINLGYKKNFERAIKLTKGDYIALCDQDDIWLSNHIESLWNNIDKNLLICGDAVISSKDSRNGQLLSYLTNFGNPYKSNSDIFRFMTMCRNPFLGMTMMMRREFINLCLPIPEKVKNHDTWFAYMAIAANSFHYIPTVITEYRLHGENVTGDYHRVSPMTTILRNFRRGNGLGRDYMIKNILRRIDSFSDNELIQEMNEYLRRDSSKIGRIKNLLYNLRNYSHIYK